MTHVIAAARLDAFGVPIDFILFGLTLLGVALFHQHVGPVPYGEKSWF